jgi:hypothetical protein
LICRRFAEDIPNTLSLRQAQNGAGSGVKSRFDALINETGNKMDKLEII